MFPQVVLSVAQHCDDFSIPHLRCYYCVIVTELDLCPGPGVGQPASATRLASGHAAFGVSRRLGAKVGFPVGHAGSDLRLVQLRVEAVARSGPDDSCAPAR